MVFHSRNGNGVLSVSENFGKDPSVFFRFHSWFGQNLSQIRIQDHLGSLVERFQKNYKIFIYKNHISWYNDKRKKEPPSSEKTKGANSSEGASGFWILKKEPLCKEKGLVFSASLL